MKKAYLKNFLTNNSNHIFAGMAIGFGIGACVTAIQRTEMYKELSEKANTKKEKLMAGIKAYWPSLLLGGVSIASVVTLDLTTMKKIATLSDVYRNLKKTTDFYAEEADRYQRKVSEKNPELHECIVKECETERTRNMPEPDELFCFTWKNKHWFFHNTKYNVLNAKYVFNQKIREKEYASIGELMDLFGIDSSLKPIEAETYGFNKKGDTMGLPTGAIFMDYEPRLAPSGISYNEFVFVDNPYQWYANLDNYDGDYEDFREQPEESYWNDDVPPFDDELE